MKHSNGFLLVIEGIDGTGKSTQAARLKEELAGRGHDVLLTKEPTNGKWGQLLRDSASKGRLSAEAELQAFIEDRKEHVATKILPALAAGKVVIMDRYYFSTAAYQGARGFDPNEIIRQNETFAPEPDMLVIMDIDPELGRSRIHSRGDVANEFETNAGLNKARAIFAAIQKPYVVRIDATLAADEITRQIVRQFELTRNSAATQRVAE